MVAPISTPASAQGGRLFASVDCFGAAESATISNFSDVDITVLGVGSLVQAGSERTFARSDPLPAGHQITYTFGRSAEGAAAGSLTQLSDRPFFAHDVAGEGVQVQTSLGTLTALCPAGIGSLAVTQPSVPVVPTLEPAPIPEIPSASDIPGAVGIVGTTGGGFSPVVAIAEGAETISPAASGPDAAPRPVELPRTGSVGFGVLALLAASLCGAGLGLRRIGR